MTIIEFVLTQPSQNIFEWVDVIKKEGYSKHEPIILMCARDCGKIKDL